MSRRRACGSSSKKRTKKRLLPWARFAAGLVFLFTIPAFAEPQPKSLAVTIDDLPIVAEGYPIRTIQSETAAILSALRKHHVPATGFVNEDKLFKAGETAARIAILASWLDAGMDLGNHGYGHLPFQTTPLASYEDAILKGETVTGKLLSDRGKMLQYYRYPFNQTGPTPEAQRALAAFLRARGYKVAPFTVENDDFLYNTVYVADLRDNPPEAVRLRITYLDGLVTALTTFEDMSQQLFGRQISQVLLIHANRLNADTLDETLTCIEQRGYRFITLQAALADPAYASPDGYTGPFGMSWLHRWAIGLHRKIWPLGQPDPPDWVQKRADAIGAK